MIILTLLYPVSANRYWNSFPLGKRIMTAPSAEAKRYKRDVAKRAQAAGINSPIIGRIHIDIELYPQRPQDWVKRARRNPLNWDDDVRCIDLDNARKCLYDAMKNIIFEDDKWVFSDTAKRMEPDGEARVVVKVRQLEAPPEKICQFDFGKTRREIQGAIAEQMAINVDRMLTSKPF